MGYIHQHCKTVRFKTYYCLLSVMSSTTSKCDYVRLTLSWDGGRECWWDMVPYGDMWELEECIEEERDLGIVLRLPGLLDPRLRSFWETSVCCWGLLLVLRGGLGGILKPVLPPPPLLPWKVLKGGCAPASILGIVTDRLLRVRLRLRLAVRLCFWPK